jgi:hypothetical protein
MSRTLSFALFCLLGASGLSTPAQAQNACAADRQRLCSAAAPGPAKAACMKANEAALSPACQAQRATMKQAAKEVHGDCHADVERLCEGTPPGGGRLKACLQSHAAELSPPCQQAVGKLQELKEQIHAGCKPDVARLCSGVAPGGGRIVACLQSHPAEISPACKVHLDQRAAKHAAPPAR